MSSKELATITGITPTAYYRFTSGALTTDSSANGHTLTDIGDPAEDASGVFGGAVVLDTNDAYSAADHANFQPTGAFTIGAWVKSTVTGATHYIFQSYSQNTNVAGITMYLSTAEKLAILLGRNTGAVNNTDYKSVVGVSTTLTNGSWHFCVFTWDTSYIRIYVDGVLDTAAVSWANAPGYAATNYVRVGCRNRTGTNEQFFVGSLDDVFLINGTALSADQIAGIYWGTKSINGVGMSGIKTFNGLARASIKTFNGI